ncbi:MAG TPA: ketoacyl-ACP synthase III [Candidatus Binatia bacterium]|jgi:3-oxoacyl-[acyl-carrier-protein] synthase-3|nr:ketoacyl-ACP synthase III [Candidatus Binatia bacterium]
MNFTFHRKRVSGILTVVPANERLFVEEMRNFNFPEARSLKLKEVMGYNKRRMVGPGVCVSDLAVFGLQRLFERGALRREEIDALVLVTLTPDHFLPPTSNLIQGRLGLKQDMLCLDLNQACAGFVVGLIEAFMLLEQESVRKVVLINGDVLSRKASPKDRNIYPLIGDAASITIVERDPEESTIYANLKTDGARGEALIIPAGGMRLPCSPETALLEDVGDNNLRAKDHLRMDGTAIFNFVQVEVPPLIEALLERAGTAMEQVDFFLCHQPNRFMLQKLADKMKVPHARMPNNVVEHFGNSGGATIPTSIAFNLSDRMRSGSSQVCLAGFGGGLTWASMLMRLGKLDFCELVDYP